MKISSNLNGQTLSQNVDQLVSIYESAKDDYGHDIDPLRLQAIDAQFNLKTDIEKEFAEKEEQRKKEKKKKIHKYHSQEDDEEQYQ